MLANLENSAVVTGLGKVNFHYNPKERQWQGMFNYHSIAFISHASKDMLKILTARLHRYVNLELPDVQAGFRKGRGTSNQIANIWWIIEKTGKVQKNICFIDYAKAFDCVDHNKLWKILKEMRIPDHLICLLRNLYAGQEATIWTRRGTMTGSKLGKKYDKTVYCHSAYLTYMQSTLWKMLGWMKHKLESRLLGKISTTSDT